MTERSTPSIYSEVAQLIDQDLEPFPSEVASVFGQVVPLSDASGDWVADIHVEHLGYGVNKIAWAERIHPNNYLEWMVRSWIIDRIERRIDFRPLIEIKNRIHELKISSESPSKIESALFAWLSDLVVKESAAGRDQVVVGAHLLYQFALEECLPGFDELRYEDLCLSAVTGRGDLMVAMRDPDGGPYNPVEVSLLTAAMNASERVSVRQKALFLVCRDWGLRPIQLALLRNEDFGRDELGPFIMVPGVKGIKRSRLRRDPSNMTRRYILEDTARAIENQIQDTRNQASEVISRLSRLAQDRGIATEAAMPMFPSRARTEDRLLRYCQSGLIFDYALHSDSGQISRDIRRMTEALNVPCQKNGRRLSEGAPMLVTAYRLRRTKGTSLAISGATLDEIAAALDHASASSVEYYLRYNSELHDYVNAIAAASPEQLEAVARWSGRMEEDDALEVGDSTVAGLGRCKRKSACPYHPTVTCYACHTFRPRMDADHDLALREIEEQQRLLTRSASGAVRTQLSVEIEGARSLILAIQASRTRDE